VGHRLGLAPEAAQAVGEVAQGGRVVVAGRDGEHAVQHAQHVVGAARAVVLGAEHPEGLAAGGGLVGAAEALEHAPRLGAVAAGVEHGGGGLERARGVVEGVEVEGGDAGALGAGGGGVEVGEAGRPEGDEVAVAALALVEALERAGGLRLGRVEGEEGLEVAGRAVGLRGELARDVGGLEQQRAAAGGVGLGRGGEGAVVEGEQVVPALVDGVEHREALEGPLPARVGAQHGVEHGGPRGRVARPLLEERQRPLAQLRGEARRVGAREREAVGLDHLVGALQGARARLGRVPAGVVGGLLRDQLQRVAENLLVIGVRAHKGLTGPCGRGGIAGADLIPEGPRRWCFDWWGVRRGKITRAPQPPSRPKR
jgi:hypothetical protein